MDQFYQELRKVQKKERNNATLARVEETFYNQLQEYVDVLKTEAMNDPFSKAPGILKQAQIIATDICQRREKKITEAAVLNIHRSYHLFTGKPQFDLVDTTPLNLTPEEEKFYYSLIDTLKNHRTTISLEKLSEDADKDKKSLIKPKETQKTTLDQKPEVKPIVEETPKQAPVVEEPQEKPKPIVSEAKPKAKPEVKQVSENIEDNPNVFDDQNEFYDFESKKVAKDAELDSKS